MHACILRQAWRLLSATLLRRFGSSSIIKPILLSWWRSCNVLCVIGGRMCGFPGFCRQRCKRILVNRKCISAKWFTIILIDFDSRQRFFTNIVGSPLVHLESFDDPQHWLDSILAHIEARDASRNDESGGASCHILRIHLHGSLLGYLDRSGSNHLFPLLRTTSGTSKLLTH